MRCTGHCCVNIKVGFDVSKFTVKSHGEDAVLKDLWEVVGTDLSDKHLTKYIYSCKMFNDKTKDCLIHDTKPPICKDYPYGKSCKQEHCTLINRGVDAEGD